MYDTTTVPEPGGFVIPNGSWGGDDDWKRPPGYVPGQGLHDPPLWKEPRDPPAPALYWTEPAD